MDLSLKTRIADGSVVVMSISGRLSSGEAVLKLRSTVQEQLEEGHRKVLIDLGEVSYIDSSGLGELITTFTTFRNRGGDVKLLNPTRRIKDLLQMTKLLSVFELFDDEARGVASFNI